MWDGSRFSIPSVASPSLPTNSHSLSYGDRSTHISLWVLRRLATCIRKSKVVILFVGTQERDKTVFYFLWVSEYLFFVTSKFMQISK